MLRPHSWGMRDTVEWFACALVYVLVCLRSLLKPSIRPGMPAGATYRVAPGRQVLVPEER